MLLLMLFLISITVPCSYNAGSSLFYKRFSDYDCWSQDDIAKLRTRRVFEQLLPPPIAPNKLDSNCVKVTLKYFRRALHLAGANEDKRTNTILKETLADTIGSYLRSELLPTSRFAYYAGYVPFRRVRELQDFYDSLKLMLNTQGLGWKKPESVPKFTNLTVEKIRIGPGKYIDSCSYVISKRDAKSCIHLPLPKLDNNNQPSAIALPFRDGGLVSLESPNSENVLLKYYTTASRCILKNSPDKCRHKDFVTFHNELWHWLKRDVAPHLADEKLYAAYGGVLRIAAAVQSYGKGLARRNLFTYQDSGVSKWHPWRTLKVSYVNVNADCTPGLYVIVVLMLGMAICLLQICYGYILGDFAGCSCGGRPKRSSMSSKEVAYATVDSNIPALLQSPQSDRKRATASISKTKTSSLGSIKTQKVYDMNEKKEKLMAVIMSDSDESEDELPTPSGVTKVSNQVETEKSNRSKSPPKIETPITEISCRTQTKTKSELPMYSTTSTITNSALTYRQQLTDSWSGTDSSTSEQSVTSTSSKSRCRRSRSSRDLAWARRVVSKHTMLNRSTSGTEMDINSFTTPLSKD